MTTSANQFGDFALFGLSRDFAATLAPKLAQWGIVPQTVDFGEQGTLFAYTTYGDFIENESLFALKLGFARTPGLTPLSTEQLVTQRILSPSHINQEGVRGNALLACLNKEKPELSIYQTLLATPQLYYTAINGDIICSSNQRVLVNLLDSPTLNEDVLPSHFLFQLAPGSLTYFQNVHRLFPGQHLYWKAGQLSINTVKTLSFVDLEETFYRSDEQAADQIYEQFKAIINLYLDDAAQAGNEAANLLSGGVDSALIQLVLNERDAETMPLNSYSYAVQVPGFEFEVTYAREASQLFKTQHTITDIHPADFPAMISRAIETVAQPIPAEADACKIMMAEFLASQENTPRLFLAGQAADAIYGMGLARKVAIFNLFQKIPAASLALNSLSTILQPASARTAHGLKEVATTLTALDKPTTFEHWPNVVCTYTNLPLARRAFGDEDLQQALAYRRGLETTYLDSSNLAEKLHTIDLLTDGYE
ncbi:MAG: asparagine synthase-related protein, partial [Chloroflexota bacterium]